MTGLGLRGAFVQIASEPGNQFFLNGLSREHRQPDNVVSLDKIEGHLDASEPGEFGQSAQGIEFVLVAILLDDLRLFHLFPAFMVDDDQVVVGGVECEIPDPFEEFAFVIVFNRLKIIVEGKFVLDEFFADAIPGFVGAYFFGEGANVVEVAHGLLGLDAGELLGHAYFEEHLMKSTFLDPSEESL
jgi:hypothetical protein